MAGKANHDFGRGTQTCRGEDVLFTLTLDMQDRLVTAGNDSNAILQAGPENHTKVSHAIPSTLALSATLSEAETALPLADELEAWIVPESDTSNRYVDPTVEHIEIGAGEIAEIRQRCWSTRARIVK